MGRKGTGKALWKAGCMLLALNLVLVGCSQSNSPEKQQGTGTSTAGKDADKPKEKVQITVAIYDRGNVPAEEGTIIKNRWTEWINENAPVEVKFVAIPRWEEDQKYNTLMASGDVPDLMFNWNPGLRNRFYAQNLLMPLDDLIEQHSPEYREILETYPAMKILGSKEDGKLYQLGKVAPMDASVGMWIRADWLKKLNLEIPTTTEELFEVMKAFAEQDPDGNNRKDTYGFHLSFVGGKLVENMFGANGGLGWKLVNGEYVIDWERPAAAEAYKKRMYEAGLIDKDYLTDQNGEKAQQDFVNGRLGIFGVLGTADARGFQIFESLKKNDPNAEIIAMELPKSEFGQFSSEPSTPYSISAVVYRHAKNPEAVMQYIDFLLQESTQKTLKYGFEGVHWQANENGCPVPIDPEKNNKELSWNFDFSMMSQPIIEGNCADYASTQLNPENPADKEFIEIIKQARAAYLSPDRPIFADIDLSTVPDLPQEILLTAETAHKLVKDTFVKSIVGGSSYPIEKAIEDAKAAWEKAGGNEVDNAHREWYANNKAGILLTKDYYFNN